MSSEIFTFLVEEPLNRHIAIDLSEVDPDLGIRVLMFSFRGSLRGWQEIDVGS